MDRSSLLRDLRALLGEDCVSAHEADRSAYAHDLWPRQLIALRAGRTPPPGPLAVAWPTSRESLASLIAFARTNGVALIPFGAGSGVVGAIQPDRDVIAVDMKRMRAIHHLDINRGYCDVDAGVLGEHLEEKLRRRGATLGHFPSSIYCSTLGGWVATRSAGQCSGRYGKIEDMVLSVEGVLATGEPFTAAPPPEGEVDLRPLIVGSEGTFGFITRATMRVWPAPATWEGVACTFRSMRDAWGAIRAIYQTGLRPAVSRLYDPFDTWLFLQGSEKHSPRSTDRPSPGRPRPALEALLRHALDHPQPLNALAHFVGDELYGRSLLILVFERSDREGDVAPIERAKGLCRASGGEDAGDAPWRRWLVRRHAVSYRQPPTYTKGVWVDTMEVASPWSRLGDLYDNVRAALGEGGFVMAHMSHAYPDGCSIYFTFAGASPTDAQALERYDAVWRRALRAAHESGGTIAHHHGVGRHKRSAMGLEWGAGVRWLEALRRAADPGGVMVRGALVSDTDEVVGVTPETAENVKVDVPSRLVTTRPGVSLTTLRDALAKEGFSLGATGEADTVREWLTQHATSTHDPVDHVVAGWTARLPSGGRGGWLPCPRRSTGPDVFPLVLRDARFGTLESVTVRVRGDDEGGPAWVAPCDAPATVKDTALAAWIDRAAREV